MYLEKPLLQQRQKKHLPGSLRTIALDVTPKCNMKCAHCYAETFAKVEPVALSVLQRALEECYQLGVYHYILQGGEPILDLERLEAILSMIHPDETYVNVVTNGWHMSPERIAWLRDRKVDKIAFSLDSGLEEEHDLRRGAGSHRRVLTAIDNVLDAGLLGSISVVVTRQSLYSDGFREAYNYAKQKGIRIDVQIAEPVGKWDGQRQLLMTPQDSSHIKKLREESPVLPNGQVMVNRDIFAGDHDHCPAGTEFLAITADGNVLPCNFLQFTLGNIRDKSVTQMRASLLSNDWFNDEHPNCLCGEDYAFIDAFIMPYVDEPKPLDAYPVFGLTRISRGEERGLEKAGDQ